MSYPFPHILQNKQHFKVSYEPIDDRSGGATRNGRRRNGSTGGGFSWFDPSQPGTEVATSNTQQHSWLRPMNWHWGSQGQGGPGRSGAAATAGATATPYRPPQPGGGQQSLGAQGAAALDSQLPPWMTSTYGRPYDDEDGGGGLGAIA